jgi:hypothetical protein
MPEACDLATEALDRIPYEKRETKAYGCALSRTPWAHPDFGEGSQVFVERRDPQGVG